MKMKTKLWLLIIASSVLGFILFLVLTLISGKLFNEGYIIDELNEIGHSIVAEAEHNQSNPAHITSLLEGTVALHPQIVLEWVSQDGALIYATNGRTESYDFNEMIQQFLNMPFNIWDVGFGINLVFTWGQEQNNPQYLIMRIPDEAMQGTQLFIYLREYRNFFQLIIPFLLFLATPYIFAILFFSRINRRLKKLMNAMNAVDADKSVVILHDNAKDEIGLMTRQFNSMSQRIHDQVTQIQEFENIRKTLIANISHDLRTPMTMIQGYAEALHNGLDQNETDRSTYTDIILRRSRYMDQLLHKLLEISNLDSKKGKLKFIESDISEHLRKIIADYVLILESKEIEFNIQIPDQPILLHTDPYLFERAIRNLIENAIQYGSSGHYLGVAVEKLTEAVQIHITDHGQGMTTEQTAQVFERFYRASDSRQGEGMGIGLSIVKEIAEAHHGRIEVLSIPNEKTVFTLILPVVHTSLK